MKKHLRFLAIFTVVIITTGSLFASTSTAATTDHTPGIAINNPAAGLFQPGDFLLNPGVSSPTADFIDIGLYATSCGDFEVRLRSLTSISSTNMTNVQFTIKWPTTSGVALTNIVTAPYYPGLAQQGTTQISGAYNYAVFVGVSGGFYSWTANTEYTLMTFSHDQTGSGTATFEIGNDSWTNANNAMYYAELIGSDATGSIYASATGVDLGKCPLYITGTFTANNKVYDGNTDATFNTYGLTLSGVKTGDVVTLLQGDVVIEFADKNIGTKTVSITNAILSGANAGKYQLFLTGAPTTTANITAKELTVINAVVTTKSYDGNTNAAITGATLSGVVGSEDVVLGNHTSGTFTSANVGTWSVTTAPMTISGADIGNYYLTQPTLSGDITARAITITADAKSKVYGAVDPALTYQITSGTIVSGDVPTGALSRAVGEDVGTYAIGQNTLTYGSNYAETYVGADLTISAAPLMITADDKSKDYGAALPTLTVSYTGLVNGDLAPATPPTISTTATASSPVGTYPITATGAVDPNYTISYTPGTLTVNAVALMITADDKSKDYGAALPTLTVSYTGLVNGDLAPATPPTISTTATASSPVGTYPITATGAVDPNYTISYTPGTLTVNAVALMITADDKSKDYGAALPTLTVSYTGLVNGDLAPATPPTISTTATASSPVGTYPITATGAVDPNYTISYTPGTLTVNAVALMITADDKSKDYGAALPTLTVSYTGLVNGDLAPATPPTISTTATASSPVGTYPITATGAVDPNYTISYTPGTLTVNAVALMITADDKSKEYGAALPTLTVSYTGLVNGDLAPSTPPTISTTATASSPVGTYPITATGAVDPNYTISYTPGTLTVNAVALMITADDKSKDYGAALPTLTVSYTGLVNGDLAPATPPTISTTATASSPVGTYPITATGAVDPNYTISYTPGTLTVNAVALMITADDKSKDYGAALPTLTVSYTGLVNGDLAPATPPTISTTATASSPVGTYPITATGAVDPNYTISYTPGTLTVNAVALMITADDKSKDYGAALPTLTVSYTGLVNGDLAPATPPTISTTATASSPVGTYPITATGAVDPNYTISYTPGTLTVNAVALMITADDKSKDYGAALPTLTVSYTGLVNGDLAPATPPTISTTATASSPVGTYPITATGAVDPNYTISYTPGTLTVNAVALMITADDKSKEYGAALPTLTVSYTGLVNGDLAPSTPPTISTTATASSPVGTYPITATGAVDPNYTISYTPGTLTVTPVTRGLKVFLQGPYNTTTHQMNTGLQSYLPSTQPFGVAPWSYTGSEALPGTLNNEVDWVLVELRSDAYTLFERAAGLVDEDGNVTVSFNTIVPGSSYFIVIWHRNHMPVMSASAIDVHNASSTIDLTLLANLYGTNPAILLEGTTYGMITGDVTKNGGLKYSGPGNDRGPIIARIVAETGSNNINGYTGSDYWQEDNSMNSVVLYIGTDDDRSYILTNLGTLTGSSLLNSTYNSVVPGAYTGGKEMGTNDGSIDIQFLETTEELSLEIISNEAIFDGLIDNIQLTLAWKTGDNEMEQMMNTFSSNFALSPQGNPVEIDGIVYQVFVSVTPVSLPQFMGDDNPVTVLTFEKTSGISLADRLWIADDTYTSENNGMYYVSVWGTDHTGIIHTAALGMNDISNTGMISIYPNPVINDILYMQMNTLKSEMLNIKIYDMQGKLMGIIEYRTDEIIGNTLSIDVSNYNPGVYLINVMSETVLYKDRFIVK